MKTINLVMGLVGIAVMFATGAVSAQIAGTSTTVGVSIVESTQVASGWSVKKTILGKMVYTDTGVKIGKVEDLIIEKDRQVSYVIIGAGGFVGIGTHNVAIPVSQIEDRRGKLVMPGATRDIVKALPRFDYADDNARRDEFIAKTQAELKNAGAEIAMMKSQAVTGTNEAKAEFALKINTSEKALEDTEDKLNEMKHAAANRWTEFEANVKDANERLKKSLAKVPT